MELLQKVRETIKKYSMLSEGDHVLIGFSGGADSICLTTILDELKKDFNLSLNAVYVDHGLRPDEVENEKAFCQDICDNLGIGFFVKSVDVKKYAKDKRLNQQEAARELRYQVYEEVSGEARATKIALGHTADDQVETVLMHLLRGAGYRGLSGIPPVRRQEVRSQKTSASSVEPSEVRSLTIIRPLIEIERKEIEEFLSQNSSLVTRHSSLPFMIDSSNLKKDYFRNWVRLTVMSELKKRNPSLVKSINRVANILREEDNYLEFIVTKTLMKLISRKYDDMIELFLLPLETMDKVILRRVLRRAIDETKGLRGIEFVHIEDIFGLIKLGKSGDRLYLPKGIRVIKKYSTLLLTSKPPLKLVPVTFVVPGEVKLKEVGITLKAEILEKIDVECDGKTSAAFDFDKLRPPLEVRARKNGDYFYPSGFGKKKKLQDFFVDSKIPRDERDSIPILISGEDIIWIGGYRMDERFKVTDKTEKFLRLIISNT